jgi:hypothetical protein
MCSCTQVLFAQQEPNKAIKKIKQSAPSPAGQQNDKARDTAATEIHSYLLPEFYYFWPIDKDDTILKYECYDAQNSLVNMDTLHNISIVQHIYFIKTFRNYMHTYIDADGKPSPSAVSKTLYRYDKKESDTWKSFDLVHNFTTELKENKQDIIRKDTTYITDPITSVNHMTIRKYYRVTEIKPKEEIEIEKQ